MSILPNCVIVDIDGTLANCEHRRQHVVCKPKNFKAFNESMHADTVHSAVDQLVRVINGQSWKIVLCSGREETYRDVTVNWLRSYQIPFHALYMRAAKDYRADDVVKSELLDRIIADKYVPLFALDDRDRVVTMWRARGMPCFQVAPGAF